MLIVFLLLIIIAILLFGSSQIIGAIGHIAGIAAAIVALLLGLALWDSLDIVGKAILIISPVAAIVAFLGALIGWAHLQERSRPSRVFDYPSPSPTPSGASETEPINRVWVWFVDDIDNRFDPDARERAYQLYAKGDAFALDNFCRAEVERL